MARVTLNAIIDADTKKFDAAIKSAQAGLLTLGKATALGDLAIGAAAATTQLLSMSNQIIGAGKALGALSFASVLAGAQAFTVLKLAMNSNDAGVKQLKDTWSGMTNELTKASTSVLPGLNAGLKSVTALTPILSKGLSDTGVVLGRLAAEAGKTLASPLFKRDIANIMADNTTSINNFGKAGITLLGPLRDLAAVAAKVLSQFSGFAPMWAQQIASFVAAKRASGELEEGFRNGVKHLIDFVRVIWNFGGIIKNVMEAANKASGDTLGKMADWLKKIKLATDEGTPGFNKMVDAFEKINRAGGKLWEIIKKLAESFKGLDVEGLANAFLKISGAAISLVPLIVAIANAFTTIIEHTPTVVITALTAAFIALKVAMLAVKGVELASHIVDVVGSIASGVARVYAWAAAWAWYASIRVTEAVSGVASTIADVVSAVASGIGRVTAYTAAWIAATAAMIAHKAVSIAQAVWGAITAVIAAIPAVLAYAATWWNAAAAVIAATWPILLVIAIIIAVGVAIWQLVEHWRGAWTAIKAVAEAVWIALQAIWNVLVIGFVAIWQAVSAVLTDAWGAVWRVIQTIATVIWDALQVAWNAVVNAFIVVWNAVSSALTEAWNTVWNVISVAAQAVWSFLQTAWNAFITGLQAIWTAVSTALLAAWNAVWGVIRDTALAIWNGLQAAWNAFINGLQAIWNAVSGALSAAWNAVWNAISAAAQAIWNAMQAAWNAFINGLQAIWNSVSSALSAAWNAVWNAISAAAQAIWNALQAAWNAILNAILATWNAISNALQSAWSAVWNAILAVGQSIWSAIQAAWTAALNVMQSIWNAFSSALSAAWSAFWNAIQAAAQAIWSAVQAAWTAFTNAVRAVFDAWSNALRAAWDAFWNAVRTAAQAVWTAIQAAWTAFTNVIRSIYDGFANALRGAWQAFWDTIRNIAQSVWDTVKDAAQRFLDGVRNAFSSFMDACANIWDRIKEIVKAPVKFVVDVVYNNALKPLVNKVLEFVGIEFRLPDVSLAKGGITGVANPDVIAKDGFLPKQATIQQGKGKGLYQWAEAETGGEAFIPLSPAKRKRSIELLGKVAGIFGMGLTGGGGCGGKCGGACGPCSGANKMVNGGVVGGQGSPNFIKAEFGFVSDVAEAVGGVASDVIGAAGDVANGVVGAGAAVVGTGLAGLANITDQLASLTSGVPLVGDALEGLADLLSKGAAGMLDVAIDRIKEALEDIPLAGIWGDGIKQIPIKLLEYIRDTVKKKEEEMAASGGGVGGISQPVQAWAPIALQAMALAGEPASNLGCLLSLMQVESGGNSGAINLTDSNAAAGVPSQGLMQVIPPTFAAYCAPLCGRGLLDPLANIYAALKYAQARYGNICVADAQPDGYASGGFHNFKESQDAMIAGAGYGPLVKWAEAETGGEAYIPLGVGKRKRSISILSDVAKQFGMNLIATQNWAGTGGKKLSMANGGIIGREHISNVAYGANHNNGNGGGNITISMPITVAKGGNLDERAVKKLEQDTIPKMRMMLQQRVGRRP